MSLAEKGIGAESLDKKAVKELPQNHMEDLSEARQLILDGDLKTLSMLYDDLLHEALPWFFIVASVHEELIIEFSLEIWVDIVCGLMAKSPPWIEDLRLRANDYECWFYQKQ